MKIGVDPVSVVPRSLLAPDSTRNWTTSRCPWWAAMLRGVDPVSVVPLSLLAPDSTRNRTTWRCPFRDAMKRGVDPVSVVPWSLLAPDSTRNRTTSRCPCWAAIIRGVAPISVVPWSLLAPDSTRNWTTTKCPWWAARKRGVIPLSLLAWSVLAPDSTKTRTTPKCPSWAAMKRGVAPSSVVPRSLLAPDSTRSRTTSRCPWWAAIQRGVAPVSVRPWSLLAPDSTRNWTTSRCPFWAAAERGVAPISVVPWSLLAPDSMRNRTTSRCPFRAAMKRGVAPLSFRPWFWLAPASSSRSTHLRFPFEAATCKGVSAYASAKLGLCGWFKCCSRSLSSFSSHATMISRSCSISGGRNSRITSCTTWRVKVWLSIKVWLSSSGQLCWRIRSRKRGTPIFWAKRCFKAFTEPSAKSTSSITAIDSPVTAESTSSMGQLSKKAPKVRDKSEYHISLVETSRTKSGCLGIMHLQDDDNNNNNNNNFNFNFNFDFHNFHNFHNLGCFPCFFRQSFCTWLSPKGVGGTEHELATGGDFQSQLAVLFRFEPGRYDDHVGRLQSVIFFLWNPESRGCSRSPYLHGSYIGIYVYIYTYKYIYCILYVICTYMSIDLFVCELCIYRYTISWKNSINHRSFDHCPIEQTKGSPVASIRWRRSLFFSFNRVLMVRNSEGMRTLLGVILWWVILPSQVDPPLPGSQG